MPSASKAPRMMSHCTGSVSWNSSTRTTSKRSRRRAHAQGASRRVAERVAQPEEDVVVGQDVQGALARLHLLAHAPRRSGGAWVPARPPPDQRRHDNGVGDVEDLAGDLARLLPREGDRVLPVRRTCAGRGRRRPRPSGRARPRPASRRGRRRRRCRARRGPAGRTRGSSRSWRRRSRRSPCPAGRSAAPARRAARPPSSRTMSSPSGRLPSGQHVGQAVEGADQAVAHPLAQLSRGHAREGHDEETVDRQVVFRHVAGRQRRDGEGLPGAGARLQQRRSPWQRPARPRTSPISSSPPACSTSAVTGAGPLSSSSNPSQTRRAYAAEPMAFGGVEEARLPRWSEVPSALSISENVSSPPRTNSCSLLLFSLSRL